LQVSNSLDIPFLRQFHAGENSVNSRDKMPGNNSNNRAYSYYNPG